MAAGVAVVVLLAGNLPWQRTSAGSRTTGRATPRFYLAGRSIAAVPVKSDPFDIGAPASLGLRGPYFYGANRRRAERPDGRFLIARMGAASLPQGSLEIQVVVGFSRVLDGRAQ